LTEGGRSLMTSPRLRFIHGSQRGFTLIEMLVAVALVGIITLGISAATMQILTINTRASNHMIAVRQVQQAGKEVSNDVLQAQIVQYVDSNFPLTLTWTEWGGNYTHEIVYHLEGDKLWRSHSLKDDEGTVIEQTTTYVARHIYVTTLEGKLVFTVTAKVGNGPLGGSETRVYEVEPRPVPLT